MDRKASEAALEAAQTEYPLMFSPLTLRSGKRLRNRICHASMSTRYGKGGEVTDKFITYHANRAKGGAALLVSEPLATRRGQRTDVRMGVWDQENFDGLKKWAAAVEGQDSRMLVQIQDPGRGRHKPGRNLSALGPSALPDDWSWSVPHAMTPSEIKQMIDDFVLSAGKLKKCGFSGVEISGGHGHVFHQFMSPWSNRREDDYGGSLENRTRLVRDLINGLRQECGDDFIVGLRLPGDDGMPNGVAGEEAERITKHFADHNKVDYFCWVQGSHSWTLEWHLPDMHWERSTFFPMIQRLKQHTNGIPVGAVGRILEPVQGESLLRDGVGDLVFLGRTLVTDAAWGLKAMQNRDNDIRKCVSCNNCWGVINLDQPIACDNNPRVGAVDEVDWWPAPAKTKKKVVVVGGGVAGLEAAWIAGARGHDVTVLNASGELGGKNRLASLLPGSEPLSSVFDFQLVMAGKAGVKFELGIQATAEDVLKYKPDAVILATGSTMIWPLGMPEAWREEGYILDLRTMAAEMLQVPVKQPGTAVIYDMDHTDGTYSAAELFLEKFDRVIIVSPREQIAKDEPVVRQQSIYQRIYKKGVEVILLSEPSEKSRFEDGVLVLKHVFTGKEEEIHDVALFTYSSSRSPNDELAEPLRKAGVELHLTGDCYAPRGLMTATEEGNRVGNLV